MKTILGEFSNTSYGVVWGERVNRGKIFTLLLFIIQFPPQGTVLDVVFRSVQIGVET